VYRLKPNARNNDALKAAGGPSPDANTDSVNLAAPAQDGAQLYISTRKEQPTGGASNGLSVVPTSSAVKKGTSNQAHSIRSNTKSDTGSKPAKLTDPKQGQININTATAEELQRVPGIGPAMAAKVIDYRKANHGFQSVEDLLQVSGIGERKFARMQPFVRIR
jgi:competence protein ComEA